MVLLSFQQPPSHSGQGTAGNAVLGPTARGSPSFPSLRARDWATSHQPRQGPRCSQEPPHLGQPDPRVFQLPCPEPLPVGTGYSFLPQRLPVRQGHGSHSTPQQHRALTMAQLPDLAHRVQALTTPHLGCPRPCLGQEHGRQEGSPTQSQGQSHSRVQISPQSRPPALPHAQTAWYRASQCEAAGVGSATHSLPPGAQHLEACCPCPSAPLQTARCQTWQPSSLTPISWVPPRPRTPTPLDSRQRCQPLPSALLEASPPAAFSEGGPDPHRSEPLVSFPITGTRLQASSKQTQGPWPDPACLAVPQVR